MPTAKVTLYRLHAEAWTKYGAAYLWNINRAKEASQEDIRHVALCLKKRGDVAAYALACKMEAAADAT